MILTCPDCATRYMTKPEAIGPNGRTVRCASCSATWFVAAEEASSFAARAPQPEVLPEQPPRKTARKNPRVKTAAHSGRSVDAPVNTPQDDFPTSVAGAMREQTEQKRASRRLMSVGAMWLVTLCILSVGALSAYVFRQNVIDQYPKAATLYKAFGVDVATGGKSVAPSAPAGPASINSQN